jgi:hypothetical protein
VTLGSSLYEARQDKILADIKLIILFTGFLTQIREQMSGPDLHVFTKKNWFFHHKKILFSAEPKILSKKI